MLMPESVGSKEELLSLSGWFRSILWTLPAVLTLEDLTCLIMKLKTGSSDVNVQVRCEGDDWYLYAHVLCKDSRIEALTEYWRAFADACETAAAKRLMVERSGAPPLSSFDPFELIKTLPPLSFTRKTVAFVDTRLQPTEIAIVESAATRHGIRLKAFVNENDAEEWLLA